MALQIIYNIGGKGKRRGKKKLRGKKKVGGGGGGNVDLGMAVKKRCQNKLKVLILCQKKNRHNLRFPKNFIVGRVCYMFIGSMRKDLNYIMKAADVVYDDSTYTNPATHIITTSDSYRSFHWLVLRMRFLGKLRGR